MIRGRIPTQWQRRFVNWGLPLLAFLAAFVPRFLDPLTRPPQWEERAFLFREALLRQDLAGTYQQYHPGVTLMWLAALGLHLFILVHGPVTQAQWFLLEPALPGLMETGILYALTPLVLVISLLIVAAYWLLTKLVSRRLALAAALLLALDPFYIAYSKVMHVDGLLASFMLVSGLSLLVYVRTGRRRYLLGSGFVAGLGFLTKTPSIFLIPYTGLILFAAQAYRLWRQDQMRNGRAWGRLLGYLSRDLFVWGIAAVLVFVVLFPALWVNGRQILVEMASNLIRHASNPHKNPIYFMGEVAVQDPGPLYYLAALGWGLTAVSLPASVMGMGVALWRGWRRRSSDRARLALALLAYAFFFFTQMSLGEFKQLAYILPAIPAVDVLAAVGLVTLADAVQRWRRRTKFAWGTAALTLLLSLQLVLVLRHHPYYGTHNNVLLGGTRVAMRIFPIQDQGEGLDLAAAYLNQLPHSQTATASVFERNMRVFRRAYAARTSIFMNPAHTFRVYDIHSQQRNLMQVSDDWQAAWATDQGQEPLFTVAFDGVTYVWVYGDPPPDPLEDGVVWQPGVQFGEHIYLPRTELSDDAISPGETLTIVHYWQSDGEAAGNYKVFNHLLAPDGSVAAQLDAVPMRGVRSLNTWPASELMEDVYHLALPADLPPGDYQLTVGFYDPETQVRLPAVGEGNGRFADDSAILGTITITVP